MPIGLEVSQSYIPMAPQTVDGINFVLFDPGAVLQSYYVGQDEMLALCAQYVPPGQFESTEWVDISEFCATPQNWFCWETTLLNESAIQAYLTAFAGAVFAFQQCGVEIPCCTNDGGGSNECDANYILQFVQPAIELKTTFEADLTPSAVLNAVAEMDETQIQTFVSLLFPGGVPEQMTCANIFSAISDGSDDCKTNICNELKTPTLIDLEQSATWLADFAQLQAPGVWCPPVKQILLSPEPPVQLQVEKDPETPETGWKVLAGGACAIAALVIGDDLLSGCQCSVFDLIVPTCDPTTPQLVKIPEVVLPDPSNPLLDYHSGNGVQVIVNMLSQLMENQGLCTQDTTWHLIGNLGETTTLTPVAPFDAIRLQVTSNPNPARIQWQPPEGGEFGGVQRFGKVCWQYADGTQGPVLFWNLQNQLFKAPDPNAVALWVAINPDIEGVGYYHASNRFPGNTYPLTDAIN
jgi:hypothetical protein